MSKVQTAFRLAREGRWSDFAAVTRAKVEPRVRRRELELNRLSGVGSSAGWLSIRRCDGLEAALAKAN